MGFPITFNWVLQCVPPDHLIVGKEYTFSKNENRSFPINTPIDLIDLERQAVAKIKIRSFLNEQGLTSGLFEVVKVYKGNEKQVLSNYWLENQ